MKYAETREFTSQYKPEKLRARISALVVAKFKAGLRLVFTPQVDPMRMSPVERRETGITKSEIDQYNAVNGPLIK